MGIVLTRTLCAMHMPRDLSCSGAVAEVRRPTNGNGHSVTYGIDGGVRAAAALRIIFWSGEYSVGEWMHLAPLLSSEHAGVRRCGVGERGSGPAYFSRDRTTEPSSG